MSGKNKKIYLVLRKIPYRRKRNDDERLEDIDGCPGLRGVGILLH